jgi:DNA-binding NarL/FixJ family response regulator
MSAEISFNHNQGRLKNNNQAMAGQLPPPGLSSRELEVLNLIVLGLANKQIAYTLNIAEETAKVHVKNILHKLGVQDRTQAATAAIQRGIIHI